MNLGLLIFKSYLNYLSKLHLTTYLVWEQILNCEIFVSTFCAHLVTL